MEVVKIIFDGKEVEIPKADLEYFQSIGAELVGTTKQSKKTTNK